MCYRYKGYVTLPSDLLAVEGIWYCDEEYLTFMRYSIKYTLNSHFYLYIYSSNGHAAIWGYVTVQLVLQVAMLL